MADGEGGLTLKDFYDYTAHQIDDEEGLINDRISWMLAFQGFLFASIALVTGTGTSTTTRLGLGLVISTVGTAVGVLTLIGVHAAYLSIDNIKQKWEKKSEGQDFPPAYGTPKASRLGRIPSHGIPIIITVAWVAFLILTLVG